VDQGFRIAGRVLAQASTAPAKFPQVDGAWAAYQGVYRTVWWEAHIMILGGRLVFFRAESDDPLKNSRILEPTDKAHIFRMIYADGIFSGLLEFQLDASGEVTGLRFPGQELIRVQGR